jgi:excinuclease ABC subunit B
MIGRTARNVNAEVVLYADTVTPSMQRAMDETDRRRVLQLAYNEEHGITPETIHKEIRSSLERMMSAYKTAAEAVELSEQDLDRTELIAMLESEMLEAAESLEFEKAAKLRDRIKLLTLQS